MIRTAIKRRKPIRRKTSARRVKQQADLVVKDLVLIRDNGRCVRCGAITNLHAAHVYPKGRYPRLRFLEINLLTLCMADHLFWAHKCPIEFAEWFLKTYPERAEQLRMLKDTAPKVNIKELLKELAP